MPPVYSVRDPPGLYHPGIPHPPPPMLSGSVDSRGLAAIVLRSVDYRRLIVAFTDSIGLQTVRNQRLNKK
jgi:hypothetical protein